MFESLRRIGVPKQKISLWHTGGGIYTLVVVLKHNSKEPTHYLELSGPGDSPTMYASYNYKNGGVLRWVDVTWGNDVFKDEGYRGGRERLDEAMRYSLTRAMERHESRRKGGQAI
jgi:hypothetical protein